MIMSHLNKLEQLVALLITIVLLKASYVSMRVVIILPLEPLRNLLRAATIKFNSFASFKRILTTIDMSSFLCQAILIILWLN